MRRLEPTDKGRTVRVHRAEGMAHDTGYTAVLDGWDSTQTKAFVTPVRPGGKRGKPETVEVKFLTFDGEKS